jgi:DNA-binding NtrC family response regulator
MEFKMPVYKRSQKLLIVDDELTVRESLQKWFEQDGYNADIAEDAYKALEKIEKESYGIVLLDIKMPGMNGLELQNKIKESAPDTIAIIMTAYAAVDTAITALKQGAFDYIVKPFNPEDLSRIVRNAIKQLELKNENTQLKHKIRHLTYIDDIIGESSQIKQVMELVKTVAPSDSTVVIRGESGTGKELIARAIHCHSPRRYFPIVPVNCGALSDNLLESELFGHEKGAFTGAHARRKGKFEMADQGTLFLDEIGNISQKMQMELLRVLESRQFHRLGGNQLIDVNIRLICATNQNLEKTVEEGTFREDLYYRINVFTIILPPLRERRSDIELLAQHFVSKYAATMNKSIHEISNSASDLLFNHDWPGNVRELENAIERAMVVGKPPSIKADDLPFQICQRDEESFDFSIAAAEKRQISKVLQKTGGNKSQAAKLLQIDRLTLYNKLKKYGLGNDN